MSRFDSSARLVLSLFFAAVLLLAGAAAGAGAGEGIDLERARKVEGTRERLREHLLDFDPVNLPGLFEALDFDVAALRWMRELLPRVRGPHVEVERYIAEALLDEELFAKLASAIGEYEGIDEEKSALALAGAAVREASRAAISLAIEDLPEEERRARRAKLDLPGRFRALRAAIASLLARCEPFDPGAEGLWKDLLAVLEPHVGGRLAELETRREKERGTLAAMRAAHREEIPDAAKKAVAALDPAHCALPSGVDSLFSALGPGKTPALYLAGEGKTHAAALEALDRVVEGALDAGDLWTGEALRALDCEVELTRPLERRARSLRAGRRIYGLEALIEVARTYRRARGWRDGDGERDGYLVRDLGASRYRVDETLEKLTAHRDRLVKDPRAGTLHAVVDRGDPGAAGAAAPEVASWEAAGWLLWKWLGPEDLADLADEGRIVKIEGRRFMLPPGATPKGVKTLDDLRARGPVRALVPAIDLGPAAGKGS